VSTRRNNTIDGLYEYYLLRAERAHLQKKAALARFYQNAAVDIERIFRVRREDNEGGEL
jgi:hypothetical protein